MAYAIGVPTDLHKRLHSGRSWTEKRRECKLKNDSNLRAIPIVLETCSVYSSDLTSQNPEQVLIGPPIPTLTELDNALLKNCQNHENVMDSNLRAIPIV